MEIMVFFRGGVLLFSYIFYKVYLILWSFFCCSILKLEIKILDLKFFLMVLFEFKSVCVWGGGVIEMYMKVDNVLWINFSLLNK